MVAVNPVQNSFLLEKTHPKERKVLCVFSLLFPTTSFVA